MTAAVIAAIITGACSVIGVILTNSASNRRMEMQIRQNQAILETKLEELSRRVDLHNQVVERTYNLESRVAVLETRTDA